MIAKVPGLGTGFKGLQQYLLKGRRGAAPDRSVWVSTRNLRVEDPEQVAALMQHTADYSRQTEKPVYHVAVSLAPGERLERDALERVADRLLVDLGLEEHQVLVAEHADGAQQHIHLMVNRVHPETHRAWSNSFDYRRIERSLRAQERELGLRVVPGRHAPVVGRGRYAGTRLSPRPFAERARELAGESLRTAGSWQELHASLSRQGLRLGPSRSGRGLVLTDGRRFVSASKVDRGASRGRLEKRLGPYEAPSRDLERLRSVSKELMTRGRLEALEARYSGALREVTSAIAAHEKTRQRVEQAAEALKAATAAVYRDPGRAFAGLAAKIERHGADSALRSLERSPGAFGRLRGSRLPGNRERGAAREELRRVLPGAVRRYSEALQAHRSATLRLEAFRGKPGRSPLEAARTARAVLTRALGRLQRVERRLAPSARLEASAARLVRRLGWRAVGRLIPHPAVQVLRVATSLVRAPAVLLDQGRER